MFLRSWLSSWLLTPICCAALLGCAVVDQYSGRAIVYNLEAERAQDQAILLNIVRAYLHRPMQFTTVSTITGTALASGGAQYTLPTNVPFRPSTQGATGIAAFPPLPTWLFSGTMSGGPAFTVPVLDTQEFYQGILKAIPAQLWDLYIQANYPPDLLFNLFVQKVVMRKKACPVTDHTRNCEFVFENYVGDDLEIDLFQALGDYLLWLGMTTELQKPRTVPFDHPHNINVRYVGAPGPAKKGTPPTAEVVAPPGGSSASDATTASKTYKLCFTPYIKPQQELVCPKSLCGAVQNQSDATAGSTAAKDQSEITAGRSGHMAAKDKSDLCAPVPNKKRATAGAESDSTDDAQETSDDDASRINPEGTATVVVFAYQGFIEELKGVVRRDVPTENGDDETRSAKLGMLEHTLSAFDSQWVTITIYMRHTEGMIYYLGELARRSLSNLYGVERRDFFVKRGRGHELYPINLNCNVEMRSKQCSYIFRLREGLEPAAADVLSVSYEGKWYSISGTYDPDQPDLSSTSLEFLKQLIAVNSSAKSLPQSSVISVVGGQ